MANSLKFTARGAFAGILLLSVGMVRSDIHDRIEYKLNRVIKDVDVIINNQTRPSCSSTVITQEDVDAGAGVYTISSSGVYCLAEDILGVILVQSDSVSLDLSNHTLNANGAPVAVAVNNVKGVWINNGFITGSTSSGILVDGCESVALYYLHMANHTLDTVSVFNSNEVNVTKVNCFGGSGERAARFDNSQNVVLAQVNVTDFVSTIGAIVEFNSCSGCSIRDCDIQRNTKAIAASNTSSSVNSRMISLNQCVSIDFGHIKVNDNFIAGATVATRNFQAIGISDCVSCYLADCEMSGNVDSVAGPFAANYGLFIGNSENIVVNGSQADLNGSLALSGIVSGVGVASSQGVRISSGYFGNIAGAAAGTGNGITFDSVSDSVILRCDLRNNYANGIELVGLNNSVSIIECIAEKNDTGFSFAATSTAECCLVQDCRALSNRTVGFDHSAAGSFTTTYIGNEAQCNGSFGFTEENFLPPLTSLISLQELSWLNGDLTVFNGNAALGARFTNISGIFPII